MRKAFGGRQLMLRPRQTHESTEAAIATQDTQEWKDRYTIRAGTETQVKTTPRNPGLRRVT